MSTKNDDNNSMVILGASAIALLGIFGIYSTMNDDYNEDNEYDEDDEECDYDQRRWEMEGWENRNNVPMVSEPYCNSGYSTNMMPPPTTTPASESYSMPANTEPYRPPPFQKPLENFDPSPLGFSTMAGGSKEGYNFENNSGLSDYETLKSYDDGSLNIPIYNEEDGQVGLPVPDMSDISAGENNKYVYDRTIGTIGFTSTKIGGRRRGQADYVRGDLAIIPDKNTNFQVSADPLNSLLEGAMNASNGIGGSEYVNAADASNASQFGAQMAMNPNADPNAPDPNSMDGLRARAQEQRVENVVNEIKVESTGGGQRAPAPKSVIEKRAKNKIANIYKNSEYSSFKPPAPYQGGTVKGLTVADIKRAAIASAKNDNKRGKPSQDFGFS